MLSDYLVKRKPALYICVTTDKYELPVAVADTAEELADMLRVDASAVYRGVRGTRKGKRGKYRRVEL